MTSAALYRVPVKMIGLYVLIFVYEYNLSPSQRFELADFYIQTVVSFQILFIFHLFYSGILHYLEKFRRDILTFVNKCGSSLN